MDDHHFDTLTRRLTASLTRRRSLGLLAPLGLRVLASPDRALAKKKRTKKNRKKPLQLNAFGCVDVGKACRANSATCCSGLCQGKKPKKGKKDTSKCVAHDAGICFADLDSCAAGVNVPCNPSNPSCFCALTTGNAGFCASFTGGPAGHCRVCTTDTDCQAEFGAGAACLVLGGICTPFCFATGRTACAPPCA